MGLKSLFELSINGPAGYVHVLVGIYEQQLTQGLVSITIAPTTCIYHHDDSVVGNAEQLSSSSVVSVELTLSSIIVLPDTNYYTETFLITSMGTELKSTCMCDNKAHGTNATLNIMGL